MNNRDIQVLVVIVNSRCVGGGVTWTGSGIGAGGVGAPGERARHGERATPPPGDAVAWRGRRGRAPSDHYCALGYVPSLRYIVSNTIQSFIGNIKKKLQKLHCGETQSQKFWCFLFKSL